MKSFLKWRLHKILIRKAFLKENNYDWELIIIFFKGYRAEELENCYNYRGIKELLQRRNLLRQFLLENYYGLERTTVAWPTNASHTFGVCEVKPC